MFIHNTRRRPSLQSLQIGHLSIKIFIDGWYLGYLLAAWPGSRHTFSSYYVYSVYQCTHQCQLWKTLLGAVTRYPGRLHAASGSCWSMMGGSRRYQLWTSRAPLVVMVVTRLLDNGSERNRFVPASPLAAARRHTRQSRGMWRGGADW